MADNEGVTFTIEGKTYALDDFELGDLMYLEDEVGDLDDPKVMRSMRFAVNLIYVIKRRENPGFTLEDAMSMKLTVFDAPAENGNGAGPPQKAAKRAARTTRAGSGANS